MPVTNSKTTSNHHVKRLEARQRRTNTPILKASKSPSTTPKRSTETTRACSISPPRHRGFTITLLMAMEARTMIRIQRDIRPVHLYRFLKDKDRRGQFVV